jgi:DNA-binding SARP family transcriptional activator/Flp pilus assembly protein TadD
MTALSREGAYVRVEFRLLGEVLAWFDGQPIDLGYQRQRSVLAALLVDANRPVPTEELVDRVWGERLPSRARESLYSYLSRLRGVLAGTGEASIAKQQAGYVLSADPTAIDLYRFRALVAEAHEHDDRAHELLEQALGLWRGRVADGADTPWFTELREELSAERLAARLDLGDRQLRRNDPRPLLLELPALAERYPLDERLAHQLMLALYRSGRQADALARYDRLRRTLADTLGVDPSLQLRELHQRILTEDPALTPATEWPRRNDLPRDVTDFTGRTGEIAGLVETLDRAPGGTVVLSAIDGMAGIGKTALAVHAAHQLTTRFPDGQLFLDLHGHTPGTPPIDPAAALASLLRALGVPGDRIPDSLDERAGLWRSRLAGRKTLVLLDNAVDAAQVRPLLPGAASCLALITSRNRLTDLDVTLSLSLDVLPAEDALTLFTDVVGAERVERDLAAARQVVALCGCLPLAVRIAAARLRSRAAWTVADLVARLRDDRLAELATGDRSVSAAFTLSYEFLTAAQQRLFRGLGLLPVDTFDVHLAAALIDVPPREAERLLEDLLDAHLIDQRADGRFQLHDLLRQHARETVERTEPAHARHVTVTRVLDYYLHTTNLAAARFAPGRRYSTAELAFPPAHTPVFDDQPAALAWCEAEYANLMSVTAYAAEWDRDAHVWQLAHALWYFFFLRGYYQDWIGTNELALVATERLGDHRAHADTLRFLGTAYWRIGDFAAALRHHQLALDGYRALGDQAGEAAALRNIGLVHERLGRYTEALADTQAGLALHEELGDRRGQGAALTALGRMQRQLGHYADALGYQQRAIELLRAVNDPWGQAGCLRERGICHARLGRYDEALANLRESAALHRKLGNGSGEGDSLNQIGVVHRLRGEFTEAIHHHEQALELTRDVGDHSEMEVLNDLGETCLAAGWPDRAREHHTHALRLAVATDQRHQQAKAHNGIAYTLRDVDPDAAREHWRQALAIYTDLGVPEADRIRAQLLLLTS